MGAVVGWQQGQLAAGVVADLGVGVVAGAAGQGDQRDGQDGQARWSAPAGEAAVGGGGPVGVQRGDTPPRAGVPGRGGGQIAGIIAIQQPEPARLSGHLRLTLKGGPGDGNGDQRRDARPGVAAAARSGSRSARSAGATTVAVPSRPVARSAIPIGPVLAAGWMRIRQPLAEVGRPAGALENGWALAVFSSPGSLLTSLA